MDLNTLKFRGLDDKLKCFVCNSYLSYNPISTCSNNQSLCGRCEAPEGIICFEDEAFEALTQCLYFPCRYESEGCCEELLPEDVPKHEENCQYRIIPCIVNDTQCNWRGSLSQLSHHCKLAHSEVILKSGEFYLDLSVSEESEHLIESKDYFLILNTKFDCESKVLSCAIHYDQYRTDCDSRTYQLRIRNEDATLSLNLNTTDYKEVEFKNWCLKSMISNNNASEVSAKIFATKEETVMVETDESQSIFSEQTHQELLLLLTCLRCHELVRPPFFRCGNKINPLCLSCKRLHDRKKCAFCQPLKSDTSLLEKLSELVYYPCDYEENGCSSKLKLDQSTSHHLVCEYRNVKCPLNESHLCTWEGAKNELKRHLLTEHDDIISTFPTFEAVLQPNDLEDKCAVVELSNILFIIVYFATDDGQGYMWAVQTIDQQDCMYEVEIIDDNHSGRRLICREKCLTVFDNEFCYFDSKQVEDFRKDGQSELKFKIHIIK